MSSVETIANALDRAANLVAAKPSRGQRIYKSVAVVEDGVACRVEEKSHVLLADLPPSMGGEDRGPSPSVLLRAALSSCVAMGIKMWASRRCVVVNRVEVSVETNVDARGQLGVADSVTPGFEVIQIHIEVDADADAAVLRDIVETSLRYSPLMAALDSAQPITTSLNFSRRSKEGT
ncbi:MAG: hypothetical protein GC155_14840 [Alphaproteobacteria bacterium]|nr:hypothetical protein [Alphaproteobacteria bacterium]